MDTAIKAEWYDVDDDERDGFLAWYHGTYLPALQARPGLIWVGHYERAPVTGTSRQPGAQGEPAAEGGATSLGSLVRDSAAKTPRIGGARRMLAIA